jgi:predicted outer membrane repeat protein
MRRRSGFSVRALFVAGALGAAATSADTLHVPDPFPTIQAAIDAAVDGDVVEIADGTYTGAGNRDLDFGGRAIVVRSASGDPTTCAIDCAGASRAFIFHGNEGPDAVVRGLTITGGSADYGAAIHLVDSDPTFIDCRIVGNAAQLQGGGLYNDNSSPTLIACEVSDNHILGAGGAAQGGGMNHVNGASPVVVACCFEQNTNASWGGALCVSAGCSPSFQDCTFNNNTAGTGGALAMLGGTPTFEHCTFIENSDSAVDDFFGDPVFNHCTFLRNTGSVYGGAIMTDNTVSPLILDCLFIDNEVTVSDGGAIMLLTGGFPEVRRCVFLGNQANRFGGAITSAANNADISDCVFSGNSAEKGGGIQLWAFGVRDIRNCTFHANTATQAGGGMYVIGTAPFTVNSCIFWNNSDSSGNVEAAQIDPPTSVALDVSYTLIQGLTVIPGVGNLDDDPRFVDALGADGVAGTPDDNVRLRPDSPAIDSGDPATVVTAGVIDLDGHARVLCDRVDLGAYEFGFGDANCDRAVDQADFLAWGDCLTGPDAGPYGPGCRALDAEFDGDVDLADLGAFMLQFGAFSGP